MVSKVAHGTERVNRIKDFKVLLASKGLKASLACVSQELILGSLLYVVYVDDIVDGIESQVLLFANDTSLFEVIKYHCI
jgi:hypothetical protein